MWGRGIGNEVTSHLLRGQSTCSKGEQSCCHESRMSPWVLSGTPSGGQSKCTGSREDPLRTPFTLNSLPHAVRTYGGTCVPRPAFAATTRDYNGASLLQGYFNSGTGCTAHWSVAKVAQARSSTFGVTPVSLPYIRLDNSIRRKFPDSCKIIEINSTLYFFRHPLWCPRNISP